MSGQTKKLPTNPWLIMLEDFMAAVKHFFFESGEVDDRSVLDERFPYGDERAGEHGEVDRTEIRFPVHLLCISSAENRCIDGIKLTFEKLFAWSIKPGIPMART